MSTVGDDDLTTDAVPRPPRTDPENDNENVHFPKFKIGKKTKSASQSKTKQVPHNGVY